jgi:hypothetical protein
MRKGAANACCIAPLNGQRKSLTKKLFCSDVASFFNQLRADDKRSSFFAPRTQFFEGKCLENKILSS